MARKPKQKHPQHKVWWDAEHGTGTEEGRVHKILFGHVRALEQDQETIHQQNLLNARLYTNRELMAVDWQGQETAVYGPLNNNLENVIASVLDTLVSRVGKNRPKATIVPRGADFDVFLKARQLDRYLWGEFQRQDIHKKAEQCFLDALIYGTGILKVDIDKYDNDIYCERVNPDEIIVDQRECVSTREPNQLHHRRLVSRMWLEETYGDLSDEVMVAIKEAQGRGFQYTSYRSPLEDQIVVVESWKLPTRVGSGDGRHTICIENATLLDEKYERKCFPYVFFRWNDPQAGFYGRSLVEDLTGYQIRLNELNEAIRMGQDLMCVPRVFVDQGSAVLGTRFDNSIGKVVQFRGTAPEALTWTAFNAEIYNERDRIRSSAFEFAGVSALSSQSKLPTQARLDSSDALREFNAIEDERFNHQAQGYETFFLDIAEHLIALSAELYTGQDVDRQNSYRSQNLVQQIDWSEVDMDRDCYVLQVSASSIINMSPAARKDKLNEWAAAGVITQEQYKAWSGEPDLEKLSDLMGASKDYMMCTIDKMLKGEPQTPDSYSNLSEGYRTVVDTYLHLRAATDCPDDILQLFRDWMEMAKDVLAPPPDPMAQPMDPAMAAAPGAPGVPMDPMMAGTAPLGDPSQLGPGAMTNPMTGAAVPSVSPIAAESFVQ